MNYLTLFLVLLVVGSLMWVSLQQKYYNLSQYIDRAVYINLDSRPDRKAEIESELDKFNIKYTRFSAIKEKHGALGCSKSHLQCIKDAKRDGVKTLLVLEDDFTFLVSKSEFYSEIHKLFESNVKFDVCLLAYNTPNVIESKEYPFLYKIVDAQTASAYIVTSKYFDILIDTWEKAVHKLEKTKDDSKYTCDQSWKPLQKRDNWYCMKTRIGKQRESYSDIQGGVVNYNV